MTRLELIMNDARRPLGPDDVEALLKGVARPEAPGDMVAKVRARLAAERAGAAGEPIAPEPWTLPVASSPSSEAPPKSRFWRTSP